MAKKIEISWELQFSDRKGTKIMLTPEMMMQQEIISNGDTEIHICTGCEILANELR